jgi:hypothetical protein
MNATSWVFLIVVLLSVTTLAVTFIPIVWRNLAGRNSRSRRQLVTRFVRLGHARNAVNGRLTPYATLQAEDYRRHYEQAQNYVDAADSEQLAVRRLETLTFTQVPAEVWPGSFFGRYPRQLVVIPWTAVQLWRIQRSLVRARKSVTAAEKELDELGRIPEYRRQLCATIAQERLPGVRQALGDERKAGITALRDLETRREQMEQEAIRLTQALAGEPALEAADRLADDLTRMERAVAQLAKEAAQIRAERINLDTRLEAVEKAFVALTAPFDNRPIPAELYPLLDRIGDLTSAARQQRQGRAFEDARALLDDGQHFLNLARKAQAVLTSLQELIRIQAGALIENEINQFQERQRQAVNRSHKLLERSEWRRLPNLLPRSIPDAAEQLAATFQSLHAEAQQLQRAHEKQVKEQERSASWAAQKLQGAWENLQQQITLSQDPRAIRYHLLLQQRKMAEGQPRQLAAFSKAADAFTAELYADARSISERLLAVGVEYQVASQAVTYAGEQRQLWPCLASEIDQLCSGAEQCRASWNGATRQGQWAKTEEELQRVEQLIKIIAEDRVNLEQHVYHLNWLDAQIADCLSRETVESDALSLNHVETMRRGAGELREKARQAGSYSDAMLLLEQGFEAAKPLLSQQARENDYLPGVDYWSR